MRVLSGAACAALVLCGAGVRFGEERRADRRRTCERHLLRRPGASWSWTATTSTTAATCCCTSPTSDSSARSRAPTARYSGAPSAQWPKGSPTEYLWSAGLWIGAIKNGEPHVSTGQYRHRVPPRAAPSWTSIYQTRELAPGGARLPATERRRRPRRQDRRGLARRPRQRRRRPHRRGLRGDLESDVLLRVQRQRPQHPAGEPGARAARDPGAAVVAVLGIAARPTTSSPSISSSSTSGFNPLDQVYVGFFADCDIGPREAEKVSEDDYAGFWEGRPSRRASAP